MRTVPRAGRLPPYFANIVKRLTKPADLLAGFMKDLSWSVGFVIHGGEAAFPLGRGVRALPAGLLAYPDR